MFYLFLFYGHPDAVQRSAVQCSAVVIALSVYMEIPPAEKAARPHAVRPELCSARDAGKQGTLW